MVLVAKRHIVKMAPQPAKRKLIKVLKANKPVKVAKKAAKATVCKKKPLTIKKKVIAKKLPLTNEEKAKLKEEREQ